MIKAAAQRRTALSHSTKVCLLSTHPLVLTGFEHALAGAKLHIESLQIESLPATAMRTMDIPPADVYVADASLPAPSLETMVAGLLERFPKARVVVVGKEFEQNQGITLLRLGVRGMIPYALAAEQLAHAIPMVMGGGIWVPRAVLSHFVQGILESPQGQRMKLAGAHQLSPREQQAMDALLQNLSNKEIASLMNISERTVKFHVSNLLMKYGVRRRADLILLNYQSLK